KMGFPNFKVLSMINGSLAQIGKYMLIDPEEEGDIDFDREEESEKPKKKVKPKEGTFYLNLDPKDALYRQRIIKKLHEANGFSEVDSDEKFRMIDSGTNINALKEILKMKLSVKRCQDPKTLYDAIHRLSDLVIDYSDKYSELAGEDAFDELRKKAKEIPKKYGGLCKNLDIAKEMTTFYIDMENSTIIPVPTSTVPKKSVIEIQSGYLIREEIEPVEIAKQGIRRVHENIIENLKRKIKPYVLEEIDFEETNSAANLIRSLAIPTTLFRAYGNYLSSYEIIDDRGKKRKTSRLRDLHYTYPNFRNRFSIKNLFPLSVENEYDNYAWSWNGAHSPVPINFNTSPDESKFLFVGLNSGGKSTLLESLTMSYILASAGLPLPADEIILPKLNKIVYYNNTNRSSFGKLETEMRDVARIIKNAERGNMIIIDNFFEGGSAQVTAPAAGKFLDVITESKACFFVESHAPLELDYFAKKGWVILTPEYRKKKGRIEPTYRIARGRPNMNDMEKYGKQLVDSSLIEAGIDEEDA
ncbi:MAG: hypothetical protein PHU12_03360, partial [Candidatus Aenigmarchaeota archaeon]|nr:hypothetical protein [Candidatus Aenigmarchaeota archaeon]